MVDGPAPADHHQPFESLRVETTIRKIDQASPYEAISCSSDLLPFLMEIERHPADHNRVFESPVRRAILQRQQVIADDPPALAARLPTVSSTVDRWPEPCWAPTRTSALLGAPTRFRTPARPRPRNAWKMAPCLVMAAPSPPSVRTPGTSPGTPRPTPWSEILPKAGRVPLARLCRRTP